MSERPLRVLAVTNLWPERGSFRGVFVKEQVEAVRDLGHQVEVEVVAQSRGTADYLLAAPRVCHRVRTGGYDLVHVHYGLTALAARFAFGVPKVLSLYGSDVNVGWQRLATSLGKGGVAARVYPSRRLAEAAGDPAGYVVPNGVDFGVFAPVDRAAARAALGIGADDRVVLFGAAPDNPVKGYDVFTDVLAEVRRRGVDARELVLAQPGQTRAEVARRFAAADVLLVTSRQGTESGPLVVKEAAVMGLPVVSVDVGDVPEILAEVTPSVVVGFPEPWGTPGARAELVRQLADATAGLLAAPTRSDGRERCGFLDARAVARQLVDVYLEVLKLMRPA
ncbi:MAG TPA: glycosyltransferase family 4 protein [Micromonosporaceae bacterium]|nr:glycosyltransferase family 4 protein [Micromonosporaceae bacterium]